MLKHADAIANSDSERATRAAFADDHRNDRRSQSAHLKEIFRDRLRLTTLFASDAGICPRCINKRHDRKSVLLGQFHP